MTDHGGSGVGVAEVLYMGRCGLPGRKDYREEDFDGEIKGVPAAII